MKKSNLYIIIFIILFSYGCAGLECPVCDKNQKANQSKIFRGRWFDNYNCALSCIEGECYDKALYFIDLAIKQKNIDKRMAKTYGMHFIDYFPHREKGIIHYNLGEFDIARKELKLSLYYEKTAKALLFLDRVRKKIFENKEQAISRPEIFVNKLNKNKILYTNSDSFVFSGHASDPQYIKEMYLNEMPVYIEFKAFI